MFIFEDTPSLPLGFNKNNVQVNPDDYSTIIAYAMCSNLYIEGLMKINYMDLGNKVTTFQTANSIDKSNASQEADFVL
jgi:hypothetical protein